LLLDFVDVVVLHTFPEMDEGVERFIWRRGRK